MKYDFGNRLVFGTTQCGKTTNQIRAIVAAALIGMAIVVLDPHRDSLAWKSFIQLVAHGFARRILFDRLSNLNRVLGYQWLRPSSEEKTYAREAANDKTIREGMDVFMRRRDMQSLATQPLTEDHTYDALQYGLYQPTPSLADVQYAFQPHHPRFQELLRTCTHPDVRAKFQAIADGTIKPGQYASAQRLIRGVFSSPAFTLRLQPTFSLPQLLDRRGILLVEGSPDSISTDAANTIMGSILMQVIHYLRSRKNPWPRVLVVGDEAGNSALIGSAGHEVRACAELQKRGGDFHFLFQHPSFGNPAIEEGMFTNSIEHVWGFQADDAGARKAAQDLGSPDFRDRVRNLHRGEFYVKRLTTVRFEKVTPLPDPWAFPGLSEEKANRALEQILKRQEYWSPCERPSKTDLKSSEPITSSSEDTLHPSCPALRLRIAVSRNSEKKGDSGKSDNAA